MNKKDALNKVIDLVGLKALATALGVSYQAVQKYVANGEMVADRVLTACEAVNWQVTPHQLRPDLYPHPQDGLPAHMREVA